MTKRTKRTNRQTMKRIIAQGCLELTSPAVFSNGDSEGPIDMVLLRDSIEDRALLPGSTLAGALRAFLEDQGETKQAALLFGTNKRNDKDGNGDQSSLIIWDALSNLDPETTIRDGVKINPATRTAEDKAKYDLEVLPVGTTFDLCFELLINEPHDNDTVYDEKPIKQALAWVLNALAEGLIPLGMKKSRGFGYGKVQQWHIHEFDLRKPAEVMKWLTWSPDQRGGTDKPSWMQGEASNPPQSQSYQLSATFTLRDSVIIRADASHVRQLPDSLSSSQLRLDAAHLTQAGTSIPIIPGTSWAGVIRHRAERICKTLNIGSKHIDSLFGFTPPPNSKETQGQQSRLFVQDSIIENQHQTQWIQNRIAIDRFTGGAYHGALFSEQPVWAGDDTQVTLSLTIKPRKDKPETIEADMGLLLLILKDLWTGDLAIGGEQSIGRGRLNGSKATLNYAGNPFVIKATADGKGLDLSAANPDRLEQFVQTFLAGYTPEEDGYASN